MTKQEAEREWRECILPEVIARYGKDKATRRESWGVFTDSLCKDGRITLRQYETWTHPRGNE